MPINAGKSTISTQSFADNLVGEQGVERPRDDDLALYDRAIERIQNGENYYDFIVEEQRRSDYPVTPGIAVRLPTLAYIDAALGMTGQTIAAVLLLLAVLAVWWRRLGEEPGSRDKRALILALLFMGASLGVNRYYFTLHELWAGMLLALAFGLHRPGKWGAALAVAALAVFIRELALPFIALMAAMALWRRDWKECVAWSALAVVFLAVLAFHLSIIAEQVVTSDQDGPDWLVLRGLSGWLSNVVLSSNLRFLPHWLAGPAVILTILGWLGWRSDAGLFGTLLYAGYGLSFTIVGRGDNFYWGAMIAPAMFIGFAFAPMALRSLFVAATAK
ncbi:MAG: hypothetical protein P8J20_16015 [Novosphingobium sp.]|nr:hypothetical protein [Novosphingobium sp.]